jgi:heat shock protein HslJ
MKNKIVNLFIAAFVIGLIFGGSVFAQSDWLDMSPLPNWNTRSRDILQTEKISADELKHCGVTIRQPSLAQDFLLTKMNWTLVGAAQVHGKTTVIGTAGAFDGMCRPLEFQMRVFVGNRVAGTLSPAPTDARTDGSLVGVKMTTGTTLTAEYLRYRESDPLCCPYKTEAVTFVIKPEAGGNFLLVPESKIQTGLIENQAGGAALTNTVWRWQDSDAPTGKTTVDKPENYQIEFKPDGNLGVKADCNGGGGNYKAEGGSISFVRIFTTKMFCGEKSLDNSFLRGLERARTYRIEGNSLFIEGAGDNGTMKFFKVVRQN